VLGSGIVNNIRRWIEAVFANAVRDIYGAYANNTRQTASQSGYDNQNPAFKEQQRQIALRNAQEAERQMRAQTSQSKPLVAVQPASPQNPQPPQLNVTGRTPQQIYGMPQNQQNARPFNPQGQRYSQPQQPLPQSNTPYTKNQMPNAIAFYQKYGRWPTAAEL
jgi:hypothetical protein